MPPIYSKEWNRITIQVRGDHRQGRTSPCEHACPLGNGIQQMHTLIAAGETGKALARLHARNPFPGITGRVCPHPCETKCNRAEYDEPVAIQREKGSRMDRLIKGNKAICEPSLTCPHDAPGI